MYTKEHSADTHRARSPARLAMIVFIAATVREAVMGTDAPAYGLWLLVLPDHG
jgi:hypothetical protein